MAEHGTDPLTAPTTTATAVAAGPDGPSPARASGWRAVLPAVLPAWLTARVIVLAAFGLAYFVHTRTYSDRNYQTPLGWDADWYRRIALHGYAHVPHEGLRFFPLFPLLARALAALPGVSVASALLVLSNGFALLYGLLLYRLARQEGMSTGPAGRVVWVAALAPAGFVMVMGYAEALSGCLIVGIMLLVRSGRWWPAAGLGLLAGALRPTGCVVTVLVLIEAARQLRGIGAADLLGRLAAVTAPALGLLSYLVWVGYRFGSPLEPFRVQTSGSLRGGTFVNPAAAVGSALRGLLAGQVPSQAPHLVWVLISLGLLVVCARRLPLSYTAFAAITVVLGATAREFQSYERYAASAVPLLLAAALVPIPTWLRPGVVALAGAAVVSYAVLSALHLYVP